MSHAAFVCTDVSMGEIESAGALEQGLAKALARAGMAAPEGVRRLTGGVAGNYGREIEHWEEEMQREAWKAWEREFANPQAQGVVPFPPANRCRAII